MSTRWLSGVLLFALGFGTALLARLPEAGAASGQGVVSGSLKYINGADFQLVYPLGGKASYLVVVSRKPGTVKALSEPQVAYKSGSAAYSKQNLDSLTIFEARPLAIWKGGDVIHCGDGPVQCILPPPPPPPWLSYTFLKSGAAPLGKLN